MYRDFKELPKTARVWIYQADRELTDSESETISAGSKRFCDQWAAHGAALDSSFQLLHNRFLVLAVNESANLPTGCSIDASVHFIKSLENSLDLNFMDRTKVAFVVNNEVFVESMSTMKESVNSGKISPTTLTFNNLVENIEDFEKNWRVKAENSWLKRYF